MCKSQLNNKMREFVFKEMPRPVDIKLVMSGLIVAMVFLPKLAFNIGDGSIGINVIILWCGISFLFLRNALSLDVSVLFLLLMFFSASLFGMIFVDVPFRITSTAILAALYVPFIFRVQLVDTEYRRIINVFQASMTIVSVIVIGQQIVQYTIGADHWLNLDDIIPKELQYPGFAYLRPYAWNSPYLEPNGIFFLEPSNLSYYLAIATVFELIEFRRNFRIILFVTAMFACLAGTGPVVLFLTAPFWILKTSRNIRIGIALLFIPCVAVALNGGWFDSVLTRSDELSRDNSSGYARVVMPLKAIAEQATEPAHWFSGNGPGTSVRGSDLVQWPFSKLLNEYGLLAAIAFHIFISTAVFAGAPSLICCLVILIPYLFFGGGFVSHATVMPLLLLGSLPRLIAVAPYRLGRHFSFDEILGSHRASAAPTPER